MHGNKHGAETHSSNADSMRNTGTFTWKSISCCIPSSHKQQLRASSNREMGKTGGKCPRQCLSSLLTCSLTNYRKPRRGIGMSWKNKESSTSAREGADPLSASPLARSSSFVCPAQFPGRSICPPASPPSPPWRSLFPQQPTVPCSKAWVAFSMPKETWIKSIKKWLWAGCGAGSKGQRVGC